MTSWTKPGVFSKDPGFDFASRLVIGRSAVGIGDVGIVLATLERIGEPEPQRWFDEWHATAEAMESRADTAAAAGHLQTASWAYLAAADYYTNALDAVDGLGDRSVPGPVFERHRRCWDAYIDASDGAFVVVEVPYEGTTLPGWLLRPDASGAARPTLVLTNGSDGSISSLAVSGALDAVARGWNAFLYDGPGQQSMLFQRDVPFRHDWEAVLTPVVDALVARGDVDADALVGYGISQAGYWLPRALAFEHRLVAAVIDPGVMDVSTSWFLHIPPPLVELLRAGEKETFDSYLTQGINDPEEARTFAFRAKPYGVTDPFDLFTEVLRYDLKDVAGSITTPMLILSPEDEQFWPGQSQQLAEAAPDVSELVPFSAHEGANTHCEPTGRQLTHMVMLDWLADRLAHR